MMPRYKFRSDQDYKEYLKNYYIGLGLQGMLFQNIMFAEADDYEEKNDPDYLCHRIVTYADKLVEIIFENKKNP